MTSVTQHQYWYLAVTEHAFEIRLSFQNQMERLLVPFTAIKAFQDPSVEFRLQFEIAGKSEVEGAPAENRPVEIEAPRPVPALPRLVETPAEDAPPAPAAGEAQVVSLDAFRKKW